MQKLDQKTLFHEVMRARERIYRLGRPTPMNPIVLSGGATIHLKREDLSPIHSYKWRGACNRMACLSDEERRRGVVAASAGNHAQGVALVASRLGQRARLFMPRSTPKMKIREVQRLGGEHVETVIEGDTYDDAARLAQDYLDRHDGVYIPPYDDPLIMAGQGTIGDEIVMAALHPEVAILQIGGGGMAAATACVLKTFYPDIHIIGVEGQGQASMALAVEKGRPTPLDGVDVFCDGTAVRQAGALTYPLCAALIDQFITVTNDEVCAAIQLLWESGRMISEPSGALGLAAAMKMEAELEGRRVVTILSGANMDFVQLAWISRRAGVGLAQRRYYQFEISERSGALLKLLESVMDGINIIDFQYGKVHETIAFPVIGFEASPMQLDLLDRRLSDLGLAHRNVTSREDVDFRIIHYRSRLFRYPYFAIIELPERAGALYEFLRDAGRLANICYFNYASTGEQVGRAMMGFEFLTPDRRDDFVAFLKQRGPVFHPLSEDVVQAILK